MALATKGQQLLSSNDIIRDPYVFDFVGLPDRFRYSEKDLENALLDNMRTFLLELGKGFAFVGQHQHLRQAHVCGFGVLSSHLEMLRAD